jgi:nucleoside 2-deoxyribosyltransferase
VFLPALATTVNPVDPWGLTSESEVAAAEAAGTSRALAHEVGRRNLEAIRSCKLLVAYLEGQELDSGTAAEIGYGAACGLRCYGLRSDIRAAGDLGARVNLQIEVLIIDSGGEVCETLEGLLDVLQRSEADSYLTRADRRGATG